MIGTGAISWKHAQAYKNIGYEITVCTDINEASGRKFAEENGAEFVRTYEEVCRHPKVDYVDVCTFPDFRLQPIEICAETKKHVQVQKPIATNLETAREMIETARKAGIVFGVVSQHRFDDSSQFLKKAISDGRLGKILQADAYVKWYRSAEYYSRPIKGSWATEGGGALINQAVHQVDMLLWLVGPVQGVVRLLAARRAAQDRIRRRDRDSSALSERRDRRDPGLHRFLARLFGAPRNPRHEGHGRHHRRQADDLGCRERQRRSLRRWRKMWRPEHRIRWRSRSSHSSASSWISAKHARPAASRWSRARKDIARWKLSYRRTSPAGAARRSLSHRMLTTVRVPASSANLGPGFDALGLALGIHLECRFRRSETLRISVSGRDSDCIPTTEDNLIWQTALTVAQRCGRDAAAGRTADP